jgi:NADH-quinone oxidoreductase subunit N
MGWERPFLGVAMWVFVLSMAGFPLTGGFLGKLLVFSAIYDAGWWWLVVIGVLATALSLAYYLNIVRALFMRQGGELPEGVVAAGGSPRRDLLLDTAVGAAIVVTIGSFFFVQPLVDLARDAAEALPL